MNMIALNETLKNLTLPQRLAAIVKMVDGPLVFTTSLGIEDQLITHHIAMQNLAIQLVTLDTGRLFPQTYDVWQATEEKYGRRIQAMFPQAAATEALVADQGINGFYYAIEMRKACCHVRKVEPLERALAGQRACAWARRRAVCATPEWAQRSTSFRSCARSSAERGRAAGPALKL